MRLPFARGRTTEREADESGNQIAIDWFYDELGRLTEERYDQGSNGTHDPGDFIARYGYDLASNRVRLGKDHDNVDPGSFSADETTVYEVDANDRLLSEATTGPASSSTTYSYDHPNGAIDLGTKQTLKDVDGDTHAYEYDNQGRLSKVTITPSGGSPTATTYRYDSNGVRVSQTTGGETTEYLIDANNPTGYAKAIEDHVAGALTRSYALGHMVLSQGYHGQHAELPDGEVRHFLHDGHGSTRFMLDALAVAQRYDYDAFGEAIGFDEQLALTAWLFAGDGIYDSASRLTQHLDRWRDGHVFLSVDAFAGNSVDPISFHKYLYAHSDPLSGIDPSGLATLVELKVAVSESSIARLGNNAKAINAQRKVAARLCSFSARFAKRYNNAYRHVQGRIGKRFQAHHVLQDARMRPLFDNYSRGMAFALPLLGGTHSKGSPHDLANTFQRRNRGRFAGGYSGVRVVAYGALLAAGCRPRDATEILTAAENHNRILGGLGGVPLL